MLTNPYHNLTGGRWLKSNFHTHAGTGAGTCGAYEMEDVLRLYKEAGYDVVCISNHDLYSDTKALGRTLGIQTINGFEYSQDSHMLCIGGTGLIKADHQKAIDECRAQGGLVVLCHPHWQHRNYWAPEALAALRGYTGIEIFNTVIFRLTGTGLATDLWDEMLSQGRLMWGFANDDFHRWFDLARCWNLVWARPGDNDDLKNALAAGRFYASTGLVLKDIGFENGTIHVAAEAPGSYDNRLCYAFYGHGGRLLSEQLDESAQYTPAAGEPYVRVQVTASHGAMMWLQPFYEASLFGSGI